MNIIVAVDTKWGIGKNNDLLFKLPNDMKYFRKKTLGKVIVMGHNTLLSFPNSKPLKDRENIVISQEFTTCESYRVVYDLDELFSLLENYNSEDVFIVGGEMLYRTMLDYANTAYITKVYTDGEATHFFPNLDQKDNWKLEEESPEVEDNGHIIKFTKYINLQPKIKK